MIVQRMYLQTQQFSVQVEMDIWGRKDVAESKSAPADPDQTVTIPRKGLASTRPDCGIVCRRVTPQASVLISLRGSHEPRILSNSLEVES